MGQVRNTKFGTNVSNKMLLNAAKYQDYSFYRFLVIKGKPTGGKITPSHSTLNFFLSTSVEMVDLEGIKDFY